MEVQFFVRCAFTQAQKYIEINKKKMLENYELKFHTWTLQNRDLKITHRE